MSAVQVPIIIPSLEPDERLIILLDNLYKKDLKNIIIVNDGSSKEFDDIFDTAQKKYGCTILKHYCNLGKGRALKNAFNYCLNAFPDLIGCITADSDGQHTVDDIFKCINKLVENPDKLILGCRNFEQENVPIKSQLGNKITRKVCKWLYDVDVSDTQTGLRAIPKEFMMYLLNVQGERFEFETNMLLETFNTISIEEVIIETVYDSKTDHTTHFDPIKDSIKIYKLFGKRFTFFLFSLVSVFGIDIILFFSFYNKVISIGLFAFFGFLILIGIISAGYYYLINYKIKFDLKYNSINITNKYFKSVMVLIVLSGVLGTIFLRYFFCEHVLLTKIIIDILIFCSFFIVKQCMTN